MVQFVLEAAGFDLVGLDRDLLAVQVPAVRWISLGRTIGKYRPGIDKQPSSYSHSPRLSVMVGLMMATGSCSGSWYTNRRFCTPTCGAARPTPLASCMVSTMSSTRRASLPSISVISADRWVRTGSPNRRIWYAATGPWLPVASCLACLRPTTSTPTRPCRPGPAQSNWPCPTSGPSCRPIAASFRPGRSTPEHWSCCAPRRRRPGAGADLLDLGCGYGPIACTLAHRATARPCGPSTSTCVPWP